MEYYAADFKRSSVQNLVASSGNTTYYKQGQALSPFTVTYIV